MGKATIRVRFSYEDLEEITDGFSEENFIGVVQFGKVYRGKLDAPEHGDGPRYVTVKIWEIPTIYNYREGDNKKRLMDELSLLEHEKINYHPCMIKLYGYCLNCYTPEKFGIVYDLEPLDTLHNLVLKDSFTWVQRIEVAFRIACLLKFLHGHNPLHLHFLLRNISAAHIMLDKDYNPILFDFGMVSGGIFPDRTIRRTDYLRGCYGYDDPGWWCEAVDVFAFGILLLMLIAKRVYTEEERLNRENSVDEWAEEECERQKNEGLGNSSSLVHASLEEEPVFFGRDGHELTRLAMQCVEYDRPPRPTMSQVVKHLRKLRVVRRHINTRMP